MSSSSKNRRFWNSTSNAYQEAHGPVLSQTPLAWGVWRIPESDLGVLGHVEERDVLELGCGAAQWTLALRQKGARAVGLDLSEEQLAHARALSRPVTAIPLVQANAETLPFRKEAFDVVFCDHEPRSLRLRKRSWRRCRECFGPPVSLPFACRRQSGTCASTPSERRSKWRSSAFRIPVEYSTINIVRSASVRAASMRRVTSSRVKTVGKRRGVFGYGRSFRLYARRNGFTKKNRSAATWSLTVRGLSFRSWSRYT